VTAPARELVTVRRDDGACWIGLNRPDKRNALDLATVEALDAALAEARREPCVVVLHSTTPGIFAAGVDIRELLARGADDALLAPNAAVFDRLEAHRWPTIALIDGPAIGGGTELALACDFRIGSDAARFGQPELSLGILAGAGGNWRLAQVVGQQWARRMLYLGEMLDAPRARELGLLDELADDPGARVGEYVGTMRARSWRALELTKLALRSQRRSTTMLDITAQALLFESEEKRLRMTGFLEERDRRRAARASDGRV
jgi:enoyl-CoA hydratase/carnithine racemase